MTTPDNQRLSRNLQSIKATLRLSLTGSLNVLRKIRPTAQLHFLRVANRAATFLLTITLGVGISFANQKNGPLSPSQALAAARSEIAKGPERASPKMVYLFACQVPPDSREYADAQSIIKANDQTVRSMGFLNDFLVPLHEVCRKVGQGLVAPDTINEVHPGHLAGQDTSRLSALAKADGFDVKYSLCGNFVSLCGYFKGNNASTYADHLFSDNRLAQELSALGYSAVLFTTLPDNGEKPQFFGMRPTKSGWILMSTKEESASPSPTAPTVK